MKSNFLIILVLLVTISVLGQRKNIAVKQIDSRFTISAERTGLSSGYESYYFYVQNTTNREYEIIVNVELDLACEGKKSYVLGNNDIIFLKPYEKYSSSNHGEVFNNFGNKNCAISEGNSYTLFKEMRYSISKVIDVTKEKEDMAAKKKADETKKNVVEKTVPQQQTATSTKTTTSSNTNSVSNQDTNSIQNSEPIKKPTNTQTVDYNKVWNKQVEEDKQKQTEVFNTLGNYLGNMAEENRREEQQKREAAKRLEAERLEGMKGVIEYRKKALNNYNENDFSFVSVPTTGGEIIDEINSKKYQFVEMVGRIRKLIENNGFVFQKIEYKDDNITLIFSQNFRVYIQFAKNDYVRSVNFICEKYIYKEIKHLFVDSRFGKNTYAGEKYLYYNAEWFHGD